MILVDYQIREAVQSRQLVIDNFSDECIQPASYDLRIGPLVYSSSSDRPDKPIDISVNGGAHRLPPYGMAVLMTLETLRLPNNILGRFGLKSGFARMGLIASTGLQVDPGFEGKLFVSIMNLTPISHVIRYKDTFLSIEFHKLEHEPKAPYKGPYQGREEITPDILEDLVRLEGLNLSQIQSQFSELSRHVQEWSAFAARFDEFLSEMQKHTKSIEELSQRIYKVVERRELEPVERRPRKVNLQTALKEIRALFEEKGTLYYSDIVEALNLDYSIVIKACKKLEDSGLIEGVFNATRRPKKASK